MTEKMMKKTTMTTTDDDDNKLTTTPTSSIPGGGESATPTSFPSPETTTPGPCQMLKAAIKANNRKLLLDLMRRVTMGCVL
jgi:hypothetical protein